MRAFVDTSSLFKKYVEEAGSEAFDLIIEDADELIVSPLTWIEMNSVIQRRIREKLLSRKDAEWIVGEARRDFNYFRIVRWSEQLENKAVELTYRYPLKTLDLIQLASACLVDLNAFLTSDRNLFQAARKEIKNVVFVGEK